MTPKENYLTAINHGIPEDVPVYSKPVRYNIGLMDPFEKGPAGGGFDGFGVMWEHLPEGATPSSDYVLTDITKWKEQVSFPDLDSIDWAAKAEKELAGFNRDEQILEYGMGNGTFERFLDLIGYEGLIFSMMDNPDACHELLNAHTEYRIKFINIVAEHYKPDFIVIYDDVAYKSAPFLSPDMYREFIKPEHKRVNDAIKAAGVMPINHCCGNAEIHIEDFIEEGAVAWSSCQPQNDIVSLLKKYGDRYSFIGGFDTHSSAASVNATEEERRAEIRRAIDTYAPYGSYILGNHIVQGKTREETFQYNSQILDEAYSYGKGFYKTLSKV